MENSVLFDSGYLVLEKKGSIYNEYKVVDVIGRGSFGVVKKIVHRTSGKPYALKIIKKSCCKNRNFMNEMEILKKLVRTNSNRVGSSEYSKFV
jgi:serine/threonine protein kinase